MGVVFRAHAVVLDRDEAVKVLRPELATADGAEAFLREARMMSSIRHPNVVVIYRAGEGKGLQYYSMELLTGPTLEARLAAGALPVRDVIRIGGDLLRGLETVHRLGVVHRDIKPSNVFVLPDRAVLSDFGIAQSVSTGAREGRGVGTPDYMAPEQVEGRPFTPRGDIYSVGVVLYESIAGRGFQEQGPNVDWSGIPPELARVLRRAVEPDPAQRWPDAATFREALERTTAASNIPKIAARVAAVLLVLGAAAYLISDRVRPPRAADPAAPTVAFDGIDYDGPDSNRYIADSLLRLVRYDLRPHVNFGNATASLFIQARMAVTGNAVQLQLTGGIPARAFDVPLERWPTLRDSVTYQILLGLWTGRSPLAGSLPLQALPHTSEGLVRFLEAEQLVAQERWQDAHTAYENAERTDPTCWICSWRITEIDRWLSQRPDPVRVRRVQLHVDSVAPLYRSLIRAPQLALRPRLDTLRAAAEDERGIFLGWFQLGDELFHRGPLAGHRRAEAIPAFERAARLRPTFGPIWEHLAWVETAEGDSAGAAAALDSLARYSSKPDAFSVGLRALLDIGFAWRFLPDSSATRVTREALGNPTTQSNPDLGAGPRLLPTFDAPRGAIALGTALEQSSVEDVRRSGILAQAFGALALGRVVDARTLLENARQLMPELDLFNAELPAVIAVVDSASIGTVDAVADLRSWITSNDRNSPLRDRAIFLSTLLGYRMPLRDSAHVDLGLFLAADSFADAGHPRAALVFLDSRDIDADARQVDPFLPAILHLRRAAWRTEIGDVEGAKNELIWHEHLDVVGLPTEGPQAAEVDWAFGTLARWRLARLLDRARPAQRVEACKAYGAVIRNWSQAPPPYGARADTARTRARALSCATAR